MLSIISPTTFTWRVPLEAHPLRMNMDLFIELILHLLSCRTHVWFMFLHLFLSKISFTNKNLYFRTCFDSNRKCSLFCGSRFFEGKTRGRYTRKKKLFVFLFFSSFTDKFVLPLGWHVWHAVWDHWVQSAYCSNNWTNLKSLCENCYHNRSCTYKLGTTGLFHLGMIEPAPVIASCIMVRLWRRCSLKTKERILQIKWVFWKSESFQRGFETTCGNLQVYVSSQTTCDSFIVTTHYLDISAPLMKFCIFLISG